ncbi:sodium:proton antiporter [Citricoccus nitrophenolicus]|uniref:Multisubunit sodium/proton antiporter MrpF subunit n=1 Tax=Citricoccus muralis TaxID=169134 RepID=A0A3D9LCF5_9MICC|nr:monovalent cation/H+ antiporter complex subunit F [Citricoccus muralis]REE04091.1 multisubunit sodium/proton antiporter MrpF subunit [Citricoccus muralis]
MTMLEGAGIICLVLLGVGALAAIYRIVRGPSILDRAIATDVLLIVISSALCVEMAVNHHTDNIVFVVVASVIGFVGSVTLSRFVAEARKEPNERA